MKKIAFILALVFVSLGMFGCSKEKAIEKSLYKNGGEWKIDVFNTEIFDQSNDTLMYSEYTTNAGSIEFYENGTVIWKITLSGTPNYFGGNWINSEDQITMIINGSVEFYKLVEHSKEKISLTREVIEDSDGDGFFIRQTSEIELTKVK
jgi:hypothetical protein